MTWLIIH